MCVIAIFACAACSSAQKQETTSSDVPATQETVAPAATPEAAPATKNQKKAAAPAAETSGGMADISGTEKSSVTCTNKSDTRKISILNVTEGGCGVVYNKMGEDKTVATAKVDMNHCENVSGKIKSNLEAAGFDCGGGASSTDKAQ